MFHVWVSVLLSVVCVVLAILGEFKLWAVLVVVVLVLVVMQGFLFWKHTRRQGRVYRAKMRRAMELEQATMNCRWTLEDDDG